MQRSVIVALAEGLHARPAAQFVAAAGSLPAKVTIAKNGGTPVATASILAIMTLGVGHGDEVVLATPEDDADALTSIDALEQFLRQTT
ncbi:HPr family phosphocarrier protein [Cellulomonas fengjieae]|uniref:Phosphocarrier protein HPr n=1 Tax=Cellulomonas fengjieae TaxID=2819978 RepID=A0ABS3SHG0_9CELL|nr:HPr family phosphocarrier protein [Cellulomonas fengjieae]MBO3085181.1 HPr family phosphocarrier protein [Cellulomonas fengjieae]MBO3100922.1 HPr family phosphocarrier protein [Cellulomonas fengjieae]QVI66247.1 HPr family phosphocarrier protein [Cellulomonas fengjieae]